MLHTWTTNISYTLDSRCARLPTPSAAPASTHLVLVPISGCVRALQSSICVTHTLHRALCYATCENWITAARIIAGSDTSGPGRLKAPPDFTRRFVCRVIARRPAQLADGTHMLLPHTRPAQNAVARTADSGDRGSGGRGSSGLSSVSIDAIYQTSVCVCIALPLITTESYLTYTAMSPARLRVCREARTYIMSTFVYLNLTTNPFFAHNLPSL